jgi:catabolite regulation protein CreA
MFRKVVVLSMLFLFGSFILSFAEEIGRVETKGLFFKDHVKVVAFDDPTIEGITCYTTVHEREL